MNRKSIIDDELTPETARALASCSCGWMQVAPSEAVAALLADTHAAFHAYLARRSAPRPRNGSLAAAPGAGQKLAGLP